MSVLSGLTKSKQKVPAAYVTQQYKHWMNQPFVSKYDRAVSLPGKSINLNFLMSLCT